MLVQKDLSTALLAMEFQKYVCPNSKLIYSIYSMYLDRQVRANSVDPDEMPQNAASHKGLHCLPVIQQFLDTTLGSKLYLLNFKTSMVRS